jgi:hypothetical protein
MILIHSITLVKIEKYNGLYSYLHTANPTKSNALLNRQSTNPTKSNALLNRQPTNPTKSIDDNTIGRTIVTCVDSSTFLNDGKNNLFIPLC